MLTYVKSAAQEEGRPEQYDPLVYFLVATHQGENDWSHRLCKASVSASKLINKKFVVHKNAFLRYQLEEQLTEEEGATTSESMERPTVNADSPFGRPVDRQRSAPFADKEFVDEEDGRVEESQFDHHVQFSKETKSGATASVKSRISSPAPS